MSEETLKIVIILKGDRGSIGIQSPDCDPVLATFEGGLEQALERVPTLTDEARTRWDSNPLYPKCEQPLPAPVKETVPVQTTRTRTRPATTTQQPFF